MPFYEVDEHETIGLMHGGVDEEEKDKPQQPSGIMNLPKSNVIVEDITPMVPDEQPVEDQYTDQEEWAAAFRKENLVGSTLNYMELQSNLADAPDDPFFNPYDQDLEGYEDEEMIGEAKSKRELDMIKRYLDRGREDRKILRESGLDGMGKSATAAILSPETLIPIGGLVYRGAKAGKALGTAGVVGGATAGIEAGREGVLHLQQPDRTFEESVVNITAAAVTAGILGGIAGRLAGTERQAVEQQVKNAIEGIEQEPLIVNPNAGIVEHDSVPNASFYQVPEGANTRLEGIPKYLGFDPNANLLRSELDATRNATLQLIDNSYILPMHRGDNPVASPISAETSVRISEGDALNAIDFTKKLWKEYSKRVAKGDRVYKSYTEFDSAIGRALRRGGVDMNEVSEVTRAAKYYRENVFNKRLRELQSTNIRDRNGNLRPLLDESNDPENAASYFSRRYNREKIRKNTQEFVADIETAMRRATAERWRSADEYKEIIEELRRINEESQVVSEATAATERGARVSDEAIIEDALDDIDFENIAYSVARNILDTQSGRAEANFSGPVSTRARKLLVPDEYIEKWLDDSAERVAMTYNSMSSRAVQVGRRFGDLDLNSAFKSIDDEVTEKIKAGGNSEKLWKQAEKDKKYLRHMRDRVMGRVDPGIDKNSLTAKNLKRARQLQLTSKLGGVQLSSLPDIGRPLMVHGMKRYAKTIKALATDSSLREMSRAEMRKFGVALDIVSNDRLMKYAGLDADEIAETATDRFFDATVDEFSKRSVMPHHNTLFKNLSGIMSTDRILHVSSLIKQGKRVKKVDRELLARLGIDEESAMEIAEEFEKHGVKEKGLLLPNTDDWESHQAVVRLQGAVNSHVEQIINTPTAGNQILKMDNAVWKTILQFKSFLMSSYNQTLLQGLQTRDAAFFTGMLGMIGIGAMTTYIKDSLSGYDRPDDPGEWLIESIDRSGFLSVPMEINNMADKLSGHSISLNAYLGGMEARRYAMRNKLETILGPSSSLIEDLMGVVEAVVNGEIDLSEGDIGAIRRTIPFQNLYYLRWLFDELEKGAGNLTGVEMNDDTTLERLGVK